MDHVLVTDGAGYIGSHACKALAAAGFGQVIRRYSPAAVMHFAAYAYVGESVSDPGKYYVNNVAGSLSLFETMREEGIDKLVFSSTCATYGAPDVERISEEVPQEPINPYGRSKLMVERILRDFDLAYGLRSISLRYFNAAGADPDGEIGEDHDPETHLIPLVLEAAYGRRPSVTVFGDDYPTHDGTCVRDYIHVTDLADAHVRALRRLIEGHPTARLNLGIGRGYSVAEVIGAAEAITGRRITTEIGERRAGDPARLVADPSKAMAALDWTPRQTRLEDIIGTAWRWHQEHWRA